MSHIHALDSGPSTGGFATCRRGGMTAAEMDLLHAHRRRERPTPWQALSAMFGRPVETLMAVHAAGRVIPRAPAAANDDAPGIDPAIEAARKAHEARFTELWLGRMSIANICLEMNMGAARVDSLRRRLGLPGRRKMDHHWTAEEDAGLWSDVVIGGMTVVEKARRMGLSRPSVQNRVTHLRRVRQMRKAAA